MSRPIKACPECIYGNPCHMICINASCRKPAFICEHGLNTKTQCALFHDKCEKMQWSELESIICENPNTKIPEMFMLQEEMENLFSALIKRVKEEHMQFKKWVSVLGFSSQTMNFINMINDGNCNNVSGVYMNQILSTLFMNEEKVVDTHFEPELARQSLAKLETQIEHLRDLYSSEARREKMLSISTSVSNSDILGMSSRVTNEHDYIRSLFPKQQIVKCTPLYRASEHHFSASEFHKRCDNVPNTLVLLETEYGRVLGGFTPLVWNSSKKHWAADKSLSSFIFSVDMREKFSLNLAQFAIACNPDKGPIFGCCDICIVDASNVEKSNAEFPISYNNFKYSRNAESSQAFTGNAKGRFTIKEWEVFQLHFAD